MLIVDSQVHIWKEETPDRAGAEVLPVVATAAGSST